jgi:hypothetical protein
VVEKFYNVGKAKVAAGAIVTAGTNLTAAIIITSKTGSDDQDLTTVAAIDAVGTVAFHSERIVLTSVTVTTDQTNDRINIDCGNITFAAAPGVSALAMIIYDKTVDTNDTTRIPIAFYDTGFPQPMDGGLVVNVTDFARVT